MMSGSLDRLKSLLSEGDRMESHVPDHATPRTPGNDISEKEPSFSQISFSTPSGPPPSSSSTQITSDSDVALSDQEKSNVRVNKSGQEHPAELTPAQREVFDGLSEVAFKKYSLAKGDRAEKTLEFCPWTMVMDYSSNFVGKRNAERVQPFFKKNVLNARIFDFFYLYHLDQPDAAPILFVPTYQFQHLLETINTVLDIRLAIPRGEEAKKFAMTFGVGKAPRPRFLGRTGRASKLEQLKRDVPPMSKDDAIGDDAPGMDSFRKNIRLLDRSKGSTKSKGAAKRKRAQKKRREDRLAWGRKIKRVQRYLGLRWRHDDPLQAARSVLQLIDSPVPLAMKPDGGVRFVAIDLEAHEFNQDKITEVGFAILDTRDLIGIPPGQNGDNWIGLIRGQHLRVKEYLHIKNKRFVQGCPEDFNFG